MMGGWGARHLCWFWFWFWWKGRGGRGDLKTNQLHRFSEQLSSVTSGVSKMNLNAKAAKEMADGRGATYCSFGESGKGLSTN
jgi:hypothetical protein